MKRTLVAVATGLLLIATTVQGAPAKPDPSFTPETSADAVEASASASTTGQGSTASATATCPPGTKASGGGFEAPYSDEVIGLVYESVRVRNRGWRASVQLLDPGEVSALSLTTYAYCRRNLPPMKTRSQSVPTTGESQIGPRVLAICARNEAAAAGGFRMPPPLVDSTVTGLYFDSLRSDSNGWTTRVVTGPAGPSTVTGEAYCSKRGAVPVAAAATSEPNARDFTSSAATASCPPGLSPAAGGFAQPGSGLMSFFIVYESRRVDHGWRISGLHSGNDPAVALEAAAYCA